MSHQIIKGRSPTMIANQETTVSRQIIVLRSILMILNPGTCINYTYPLYTKRPVVRNRIWNRSRPILAVLTREGSLKKEQKYVTPRYKEVTTRTVHPPGQSHQKMMTTIPR